MRGVAEPPRNWSTTMIDIELFPLQRGDCINKPFSWSRRKREEVRCHKPTSSPRINNHSAPTNRPHQSPQPAPRPPDTMSGHLLEPILQRQTRARDEKESANRASFHSISECPRLEIVLYPRHRERTQECSGPPKYRSKGPCA